MRIRHLSFTDQGGLSPEFASARAEELSMQEAARYAERAEAFARFLETTPNLNAQYENEITTVTDIFAKYKMPVRPIYILGGEDFAKVESFSRSPDAGPGGSHGGKYLFDVTILEHTEADSRVFGSDYTVGSAIHESAHGTGGDPVPLIMTRERTFSHEDDPMPFTIVRALTTTIDRNFSKNRLVRTGHITDPLWAKEGSFIEEGYADMLRVHFMHEIGGMLPTESSTISIELPNGTRVNCVSPDSSMPVSNEDGSINVPLDYMGYVANTHGGVEFSISVPGIAAYGLYLLEQNSPGLISKMIKARKADSSHAKRAKHIQHIEAIQPGLYPTLRRLPYNELGFADGLRLIADAVEK